MKKLAAVLLTGLIIVSCSTKKICKGDKVEKSNKQKVAELLRSIETGAKEPVGYINSDKYIQHNQMVKDGLAGFGEVLSQLPKGSAKANTKRAFQDGDFVFTHTEYNFFGPKIGFDIFRFEDGKIVEHWDNLQETVTKTASGRSMIDGPTEGKDLAKTEENRKLIKNFLRDVFYNKAPEKITDYISTVKYHQHNPGVKDGLAGFGEAMKALAEAGMPMKYKKTHKVLVEGNFALVVSEGTFMKKDVSFYDLFRIENGKVVEHWDTIEELIPANKAQNNNGKFNF